MNSVRSNSARENLLANTNLDQEDLRKLGKGFLGRIYMVRSQMQTWNAKGYSFRQVATWNTEEYKRESQIPRRQIQMFWHEVDLLKRIILLAEFCKANGLDFHKEFAADKMAEKIANRYQRALDKLFEKYTEVGITYDVLKPFLLSKTKISSDKLPAIILDRVVKTISPRLISSEAKRQFKQQVPHNEETLEDFKHVCDHVEYYSTYLDSFQKRYQLYQSDPKRYALLVPRTGQVEEAAKIQKHLDFYKSVARQMAAESLTQLRNGFRALGRKGQSKGSKRGPKAVKSAAVTTR